MNGLYVSRCMLMGPQDNAEGFSGNLETGNCWVVSEGLFQKQRGYPDEKQQT